MDLHELKSRELLSLLGAKRHIIPFMPGRVLGLRRMYHGQGQGENSRNLSKFLIYMFGLTREIRILRKSSHRNL